MLKDIWLYHRRICLERKWSTKVLTFEEVVQLLKEVCVTNNENLIISYNSDDDSDGCFPLVSSIIS